jgi:glycosyltransferase involved in cell wall biosynthesis
MASPTFSVVLCTRNRATLLAEAVQSLLAIDFSPEQFEVCIVDNDSSDDTPRVVERFAQQAPFVVRHVREKKLGLSAARNRGIREARGRYVFFTDDDQLVDPGILREHLRVATVHRARAIQGAIALEFPSGRPGWLRGPLATVFGQTRDVPEGPANIDLYGGNMVFERSLFDAVAAFREDLGKGAAGYSEDIELTQRLRALGEPIVYAPTARIFHVIGPDRANASFLRKNSFEKGYSDGLIKTQARGRIAARSLLKAVTQGALALASLPSRHHSVLAQTRALDHLGRAFGVIRAVRAVRAR